MTDQSLASAHLRTLGVAYASSDPVAAEDALRRSLQLEPGVACTHAGLARVLCRLNRYSEAEAHLDRALALDPHHDEATALHAELLVAEGKVPDAIRRYVVAAANGASARVITGFADLLARLGLRDDAASRYRDALGRDESCEAHANLALLAADDGRLEEALGGFDRALELDPTAAEVMVNRANVLVELGRLDEAEDAFVSLTVDPDVAGAAWWGIAALSDLRGDVAAASAARERAVVAAPELARRCASLVIEA